MGEVTLEQAKLAIQKMRERPLQLTKETARAMPDVRLVRHQQNVAVKLMLIMLVSGLANLIGGLAYFGHSFTYQLLILLVSALALAVCVRFAARFSASSKILELFASAGPQNLTDLHFPQTTTGH